MSFGGEVRPAGSGITSLFYSSACGTGGATFDLIDSRCDYASLYYDLAMYIFFRPKQKTVIAANSKINRMVLTKMMM